MGETKISYHYPPSSAIHIRIAQSSGREVPPMHYSEGEGLKTLVSRIIVVYRRNNYVVSCMQKTKKQKQKDLKNYI